MLVFSHIQHLDKRIIFHGDAFRHPFPGDVDQLREKPGALIVGFAMGVFRLAVDTPVKLIENFHYAQGSFMWVANNIFFQYYSLLIFLVSATVMVVVSYMSEAPSLEKISGLTYGTITDADKRESRSSWDARDVISTVLVLLLIGAAYLFFVG